MNIRQILQKEIEESELSRYKISQITGVEQAVLCRFLQGGSMKIETADLLLEFFGYELRKRKTGKRG